MILRQRCCLVIWSPSRQQRHLGRVPVRPHRRIRLTSDAAMKSPKGTQNQPPIVLPHHHHYRRRRRILGIVLWIAPPLAVQQSYRTRRRNLQRTACWCVFANTTTHRRRAAVDAGTFTLMTIPTARPMPLLLLPRQPPLQREKSLHTDSFITTRIEIRKGVLLLLLLARLRHISTTGRVINLWIR